ncbi:MAG TPA: hypothetical protein VN775_06565 [Opitutaceae bacterium]|nr:hypothetical protein [Opitutaceae bacterium]
MRGSAAWARTWEESDGSIRRIRTRPGQSRAASTKTAARACDSGSAISGVSCAHAIVRTPGRRSSSTAPATLGPTPSSRRRVLP